MKKLAIAFLALFTMTSAMAANVHIYSAKLPTYVGFDTVADASFQMDKTTGEGHVIINVTDYSWDYIDHYDQWGRRYPQRVRMPINVLRDSVRVEGLNLHGDQVIYAGENGDVNCGRLGQSSVLRRPTIFLTGKCKLNAHVLGRGNETRVEVNMTTK